MTCEGGDCKDNKKLSECKYCKKLYCEVHIKPVMPGSMPSKNIGEQGVEVKGHVCPQAYEDLAREVVAKKDDKIDVWKKPAVIEADWVIDVKTEQDVEVVRETMLAGNELYRSILVNIDRKLDEEKRNKIAETLAEFAKESNWTISLYSNTRLHFDPPRSMEEGRPNLWERFVKWLSG
jgi:SepF-like predicted cell division protein (DUF552 family)